MNHDYGQDERRNEAKVEVLSVQIAEIRSEAARHVHRNPEGCCRLESADIEIEALSARVAVSSRISMLVVSGVR